MTEKKQTITYTGRDRVLRYANTRAKVGDQIFIAYEDSNGGDDVRAAEVIAVRPGRFVTSVEILVATADGSGTYRAHVSDDSFNNLTDFNINRLDLYRPRA